MLANVHLADARLPPVCLERSTSSTSRHGPAPGQTNTKCRWAQYISVHNRHYTYPRRRCKGELVLYGVWSHCGDGLRQSVCRLASQCINARTPCAVTGDALAQCTVHCSDCTHQARHLSSNGSVGRPLLAVLSSFAKVKPKQRDRSATAHCHTVPYNEPFAYKLHSLAGAASFSPAGRSTLVQ